ncbi:hypothetical protein [Bacillus sp. CGMCC 1.16541]|uniref:hypothetical protein n=1 Tax=Bacillus sp. CGMCC 1.16541 TaxID=2185143 RepID=UPI000D73E6BF|nr:hypothetical protein [Bacillus sp. CGMCC 1.16541]
MLGNTKQYHSLVDKVTEHADQYYNGEFTLIRKRFNGELCWLFCFQRVDEIDSGVEELMAYGSTPEEAMEMGLLGDISYIGIESMIWSDVYPIEDLTPIVETESTLSISTETMAYACQQNESLRNFVMSGHIVKRQSNWFISQEALSHLKNVQPVTI